MEQITKTVSRRQPWWGEAIHRARGEDGALEAWRVAGPDHIFLAAAFGSGTSTAPCRAPSAVLMRKAMATKWTRHSLRFEQSFQGAYVYLDRCGAFLVKASRDLGFIVGDVKPSGASLIHPEQAIHAFVSPSKIEVRLEPADEDEARFRQVGKEFTDLAKSMFEVDLLDRNVVAEQWVAPCDTIDQALKLTLSLPVDTDSALQTAVEMRNEEKSFYNWYRSGSWLLQLKANAITFESVSKTQRTPAIYTPKARAKQISRLNAQRHGVEHPYGVMIEAILIEEEPPRLQDLSEHFILCETKARQFRQFLTK